MKSEVQVTKLVNSSHFESENLSSPSKATHSRRTPLLLSLSQFLVHHDFRQRSLPPCDLPWLRSHGIDHPLPLR
ncbi:hypothetical protein CGCS363_v003027 [Colletotrichum siamense]|uniref:uncharacterized protein n=1 Tax=Colletotrichum siamense TaxID=690259 RepID=UPI001872482F|nr:uncharacterized protein CGCS363_v003027 [Colletotrichum siamense]KAF5510744.1 hypothetical protein CGCS363_v003027 [Colletotrichum siamense]